MLTTSNTQYNTQRIKTVAAVQTFKKQYSFEACIAAMADPGEGPGGAGPPPYVLCFDHNEARRTEKKNFGHPPPPPFTAAKADVGEGPGGPAHHCFLTKMRPEGPKKNFFGDQPPPLSQGLMTTLPPFSDGLDPPLCSN